ncbi:MAG: hypothetical protein Q9220_006385 [cf. Caloplaca sp. 1 TL-2023]
MMLGKLLSSLLLCVPISARYLTITAGSSDLTRTQCKTLVGSSSQKSVPTYRVSRDALLPEIILVLAVSTPTSTITPPAVTATETLQTYATTTVTASTETDTFSTTSTYYATESITTTDTHFSTSTVTSTSTSRSVIVEPTPSDWVSVKNSTALEDREGDDAIPQGPDVQQPLQDDEFNARGGWPPKIPTPPGLPRPNNTFTDLYPFSVTCLETVRTRYIKMIIFVPPYTTTTTIPPSTSTTTDFETVSSTSTVVPDEVTVIESFSTTSTTTTTLTSVVTDVASATERVNATTTTTIYAACATQNQLGPKVGNGQFIRYTNIFDSTGRADIQEMDSQYDCCVSCLLSSENCQFSTMIWGPTPHRCGRLLNLAFCRGQDYGAGFAATVPDEPDFEGQSVSNGPCGRLISSSSSLLVDQSPSEKMVEL